MRKLSAIVLCALLIPSASAQGKKARNPHIADTPPLAPAEQVKAFRVPEGFVIELVAAEPEVKKPINIAFDVQGRLWVTGSEEYPFPAPKDRTPKDTVKILEDFGPDGRARKVTTFADGLNIPIGVQPLPDGKSAVVFSIPNIYLMTDTDGDGKADERKVLYSGYGFKDTHGMTGEFQYWIDGWIYCCHGFANASKVKSLGETAVSMQSGNTYRIKPDGSRIEQFTWGQVNPFGLTFDPRGLLYSADCHSRPVYQLLKGAYYPSFGKPHDGLGFGPEMVTHDHGSTAICGIAYYADEHFPPEFRDNIFIGNVITNRVNRDSIEWHGSSPRGIAQPDLVVSSDPWFRPVDIKLGPDGALYVADFYNRIIGHYEVPLDHPGRDREKGRIWRIRYAGKDGKNALPPLPDLLKQSTPDLVQNLDSANLTLRMLATQALVQLGRKNRLKISELFRTATKGGTPRQIMHAMWVYEQLKALDPALFLEAARHDDAVLRAQALKVLAERSALPPASRKLVLEKLKDADPLVQRAAAEALAAHPDLKNVPPLLECRAAVPAKDTHLLHVVRMALRDQLKGDKGPLDLDLKSLTQKDIKALADVCLGVHTEHAAEFALDCLTKHPAALAEALKLAHHAVRHGKEESGRLVLNFARAKHPENTPLLAQFLNTVKKARQERGGGLNKEEMAWAEELVERLMGSPTAGEVQLGIDLAGDLKIARVAAAIAGLVANPKADETQRRRGVSALVSIDAAAHLPLLSRLLTGEGEKLAIQEQIAQALAASNRPEAHQALSKAMESVPARVQVAIGLALAGSPQGAEELLKTVAAGKASARLLTEPAIAKRLEEAKLPMIKDRLAALTKGLPAADARLLEQQEKRRAGFALAKADKKEGKALYVKHCANCHQLGGEGAKIGPQLDGIGNRGLERLLEDILDPSRNIDQTFRASVINLKGGQVFNGLIVRKEGKVLILADNVGKEIRIPEDEIDEQRLLNLSPMPSTFFESLPEREFYDLLAFLLEQRVK